MIVLFWSRATRDLLKSFGWGIGALHRLDAATKLPFPRRSPHSISRSPVAGTTVFDIAPFDPLRHSFCAVTAWRVGDLCHISSGNTTRRTSWMTARGTRAGRH